MEETIIGLCYHRTAIDTHTTNRCSSPYWVAREEVVVLRSAKEAYNTQLHNHLVDKFLCLLFCKSAILQVTLNIYIKECTNTAKRHSCTILILYSSKIAKVCPLYSLASICSRTCYIKSISSTHALKLLKSLYLL